MRPFGVKRMMFRKSIMIISSPFKYFLATIMWLTNPVLGGQSYIKGIYDLNNNGVREVLILRSGQPGIMLIELTNSSISDTLWSYTLPDGRQFTDALVMDINKNGQPDLIATAARQPKNGDRNWCRKRYRKTHAKIADFEPICGTFWEPKCHQKSVEFREQKQEGRESRKKRFF